MYIFRFRILSAADDTSSRVKHFVGPAAESYGQANARMHMSQTCSITPPVNCCHELNEASKLQYWVCPKFVIYTGSDEQALAQATPDDENCSKS